MDGIFLESETFDDLGGWTVDTQCIEAMGAMYLFAHGIGKPVRDARTEFHTREKTLWHVHVRTRDWTAVWKRGTPAGRFLLLIDETPLEQILGTNGSEWNWQKAGSVELEGGLHCLALHDLTGFDARCDAVYLTPDAADLPPNDRTALSSFRRRICRTVIADDPEEYDLLICGGGYAGICAGIAAQRKGLKFKLIQDRPVLGGCGSSEVRVWTGGKVNLPPYPELGNIATAISPIRGRPGDKKDAELFEDARKAVLFTPSKELLLNEVLLAVETDPTDPSKIMAIITRSVRTGKETRRKAKLFADCTGDAVLSRLTGCKIMYGCESRAEFGESLAPEEPERMVMGHSTLWETRVRDREAAFPDIDWGIEFNDDNALARFDCCWDWETGQYRDQVMEIERIRDYGLMTCYANWSFLKNHSRRKEEWKNMELVWISAIGGKRESYRVCGDLILTQNDLENKVPYEDATGAVTWSIDLHYPDPENLKKFGEAFQSCAYHRGIRMPYPVPYRCLYARDVQNLFLGGRCLSLSHVAFSSVRVMRTLGMLGEVVGMAAEICIRNGCSPRDVYEKYLSELKESMRQGIPINPPCAYNTGGGESYHFMRPIGMFGNETENCWIHFREDGSPTTLVPDSLKENIAELNVVHQNGKRFGKP
ncbi:MAG: FAD dependent oxidoreductase [Lentisphaerae bacterium ADurb.Bin242]|nr:MAG: FAD dependent oxidoreductase [Lentisphaerae bacterium ADurb.Bin242]